MTIKILDIIRRPSFYLTQDVPETGLCLRLLVEPTQLDPIELESFSCLK
jgi:hypothetical protein